MLGEGNSRLLLLLLGAAHSLNHSLLLVLPLFLLTIVEEFGTSVETIGLVWGVSLLIYGAGGIVGGQISDRFGETKTIIAGLALSGISAFIFLFTHNFLELAAGLLFMAAFASLYHPTANSLISKVFHEDMAEAMGIHGTGGNVGYMFAPIIAAVLGGFWGWRSSFIFFGLLSLSLSTLFLKTTPQKLKKTRMSGDIRDAVDVPGLWTLLAYNMAVGLYYKGVDFIFPTFLEKKNFSPIVTGFAVSCILGIGILGQWLSGKASDSVGPKKVLVATSIGITLGLIFLQVIPAPIAGVSLFILFYGFSFYGHQPALNSLAGLITPDNLRGTVFGVLFFLSFGLGSLSTAIVGLCANRYSIGSAFYVMMLFSVVALLLSFLTPPPSQARRSRKQDN